MASTKAQGQVDVLSHNDDDLPSYELRERRKGAATRTNTIQTTTTEGEAPELPPSASIFAPNKAYYLKSEGFASKKMVVCDITTSLDLTEAFDTSDTFKKAFRDKAKEIGEVPGTSSIWTLTKPHWYNKSYSIFESSEIETASSTAGEPIAHWKHPIASTGTAKLTFDANSKYAHHEISIKVISWTRRTCEFVINSIPYRWKHDNKFRSSKMTLIRCLGGEETTIARYVQPWHVWGMARGVLVMDDREDVKDLIVVLSAFTMLARIEQRHAERFAPQIYNPVNVFLRTVSWQVWQLLCFGQSRGKPAKSRWLD